MTNGQTTTSHIPSRRVVLRYATTKSLRTCSIWGVVFCISIWASYSGYKTSYPQLADRKVLAHSLNGNAGIQALFGIPHSLDTAVGFTAWRAMGIFSLVGAVVGLLLSTRVLRGEEDSGRWELFLSGNTTPMRASINAVLGLITGPLLMALLVTTATMTTMSADHVQLASALFFGFSLSSATFLFCVIGAFTSQLASHRRQASLIGAGVLGASFLVRVVADSQHSLHWMQWITPLGWIEATRPLTNHQGLALLLIGILMVVLVIATAISARIRDLEGSILPSNDSAPPRLRLLNSSTGLTVRLMTGGLIGWSIGVFVFSFVFGLVAKAAGRALESSTKATEVLRRLGSHSSGAAAYLGVAFLVISAIVGLQAAAYVAATRDEEAQGSVENLLVRTVPIRRWLSIRVLAAIVAIAVVCLAAGLGGWLGETCEHTNISLVEMIKAALNILPLALFILGFGTLFHIVMPRSAAVVGYGIVGWSFILEMIGSVIKANHWLLDSSLMHHLAPAPAANPNVNANFALVVSFVIMTAVAVFLFPRRDIVNQ